MRRVLPVLGVVMTLALVSLAASVHAAPTAAPAAAPVSWQAHVGAQTADESLQALAFFPEDVFVNVGDTINWSFDTAEPHTLTLVPAGQAPPANPNASPAPSGSTFDNTAVVNSGVIFGPDKTYSVVLGATGDYTYLCLIHRVTMTARVHVNPAGSPYPHVQAEYDREARNQTRGDLEDGSDIREDNLKAARAVDNHVITGGGDGQVFVARFLPAVQRVKLGETVTWTNPDSITPHTVTFGPTPSTTPTGLDVLGPPGHATISANPVTTTVSSGLIGVRRPQGPDFSVTFNATGTFSYFCSLHSALGMTAKIVVTRTGAD